MPCLILRTTQRRIPRIRTRWQTTAQPTTATTTVVMHLSRRSTIPKTLPGLDARRLGELAMPVNELTLLVVSSSSGCGQYPVLSQVPLQSFSSWPPILTDLRLQAMSGLANDASSVVLVMPVKMASVRRLNTFMMLPQKLSARFSAPTTTPMPTPPVLHRTDKTPPPREIPRSRMLGVPSSPRELRRPFPSTRAGHRRRLQCRTASRLPRNRRQSQPPSQVVPTTIRHR
jgi:hypothetical protein